MALAGAARRRGGGRGPPPASPAQFSPSLHLSRMSATPVAYHSGTPQKSSCKSAGSLSLCCSIHTRSASTLLAVQCAVSHALRAADEFAHRAAAGLVQIRASGELRGSTCAGVSVVRILASAHGRRRALLLPSTGRSGTVHDGDARTASVPLKWAQTGERGTSGQYTCRSECCPHFSERAWAAQSPLDALPQVPAEPARSRRAHSFSTAHARAKRPCRCAAACPASVRSVRTWDTLSTAAHHRKGATPACSGDAADEQL